MELWCILTKKCIYLKFWHYGSYCPTIFLFCTWCLHRNDFDRTQLMFHISISALYLFCNQVFAEIRGSCLEWEPESTQVTRNTIHNAHFWKYCSKNECMLKIAGCSRRHVGSNRDEESSLHPGKYHQSVPHIMWGNSKPTAAVQSCACVTTEQQLRARSGLVIHVQNRCQSPLQPTCF